MSKRKIDRDFLLASTPESEWKFWLECHDTSGFSQEELTRLKYAFACGAIVLYKLLTEACGQLLAADILQFNNQWVDALHKILDAGINGKDNVRPRCPGCGNLLPTELPKLIDMSGCMCGKCGIWFRFQDGELRTLTDEDKANLDDEDKMVMDLFGVLDQAIKDAGADGKDYLLRMQEMRDAVTRWRKEHPEKNAMIQFNVPPSVALIAPLDRAMLKGLITANAEGLDLIKAVTETQEGKPAPTAIMLRLALELDKPD